MTSSAARLRPADRRRATPPGRRGPRPGRGRAPRPRPRHRRRTRSRATSKTSSWWCTSSAAVGSSSSMQLGVAGPAPGEGHAGPLPSRERDGTRGSPRWTDIGRPQGVAPTTVRRRPPRARCRPTGCGPCARRRRTSERERHGDLLGQHGSPPGQLEVGPVPGRATVDDHRPARRAPGRRTSAASSVDLPAPFGPDQGQQLAGADLEVDAVEDAAAAEVDAEAAGRRTSGAPDATGGRARRRCGPHLTPSRPGWPGCGAASQKKNGLPTSAVSTPSGTSAGSAIVRAARSPTTSSTAPPRAEATTSTRWAGPTTMRTRWGTTRPTNRMMPLTATAAAVSRATTTSITTRSRSTSTPSGGPSAPPGRAGRASAPMSTASARAEQRDRQHRRHLGPGRLGDAAELPEGDRPQLGVGREEHEQADERAGQGVDGDAGEDQGDDLGAAVVACRQVDETEGDEPPDEGRDGEAPAPERP